MEIIKLIAKVIVGNACLYLLFAFISFDINPLNWWLITSTIGRVLFILIQFKLVHIIIEE